MWHLTLRGGGYKALVEKSTLFFCSFPNKVPITKVLPTYSDFEKMLVVYTLQLETFWLRQITSKFLMHSLQFIHCLIRFSQGTVRTPST